MSPWLVLNNMLVLFCFVFVCGRGRDACDHSCRISWVYRQKSNRNTFFPGFFFFFCFFFFFIYYTYLFLEAMPQLFDDWFLKSKSEAPLSSPQLQNFASTVCPLWMCSTESHRVVDEFMRRWHWCLRCVLTGPGGVQPAVNQPAQCWPRVLHGSLDWCLLPAQISGGNSHDLLQCEPLCIF